MASEAFLVVVVGSISGCPALIVKYLIVVERTARCGNKRRCKKKKKKSETIQMVPKNVFGIGLSSWVMIFENSTFFSIK